MRGAVKESRTLEECLVISPTFPISRGWMDGTYWEMGLVFTIELTNNSCHPPGIPRVLYVEEKCLAVLIEEMIDP